MKRDMSLDILLIMATALQQLLPHHLSVQGPAKPAARVTRQSQLLGKESDSRRQAYANLAAASYAAWTRLSLVPTSRSESKT